jgi:hypothetical protein
MSSYGKPKRFMPGAFQRKEVIAMNDERSKAAPMPAAPVSDELVIAIIDAATKLTELGAPKHSGVWVDNFRKIWSNVKSARNDRAWP